MNKTWIIAQREFLTRVKKKTFLLSTILLPLLIFGFYGLMIYFSVAGDSYKIAIVDKAHVFGDSIEKKEGDIQFKLLREDSSSVRKRVENKEYDGYLFVPENFNALGNDSLQLRTANTVGLVNRSNIEKKINSALKEARFVKLDIPKSRLDSLQRSTEISFVPLSGKSEGSESKTELSSVVGYITGFLIYIVLFVYGTMVMRGVMEEKVSRIAEVIVSSARPYQLMMGKIIGIGAVGLVQFLIWAILIIGLQFAMALISPDLASHASSTPMPGAGAAQAVQAAQSSGAAAGITKALASVNLPLIIGCFIFYFLGGYLLYSSLFASVGSAVNEDPQDAQSLMLPITMPIIFAIVIMTKAVNNPNSGIAVFGSLFPLTSPVVMMARIAHGVPDGVPLWQLLLSGLLLIAGFLGTTWMAAKIYRTGILLYGKKVTWKEMWKWAFRKS